MIEFTEVFLIVAVVLLQAQLIGSRRALLSLHYEHKVTDEFTFDLAKIAAWAAKQNELPDDMKKEVDSMLDLIGRRERAESENITLGA